MRSLPFLFRNASSKGMSVLFLFLLRGREGAFPPLHRSGRDLCDAFEQSFLLIYGFSKHLFRLFPSFFLLMERLRFFDGRLPSPLSHHTELSPPLFFFPPQDHENSRLLLIVTARASREEFSFSFSPRKSEKRKAYGFPSPFLFL